MARRALGRQRAVALEKAWRRTAENGVPGQQHRENTGPAVLTAPPGAAGQAGSWVPKALLTLRPLLRPGPLLTAKHRCSDRRFLQDTDQH